MHATNTQSEAQTKAYIQYLEDTMSLHQPIESAPDHRIAIRTLLIHALEQGHLSLDGPWHLSSTYDAELTHRAGFTPPGGWHALAGLLVGCQLFRADAKLGFVPVADLEDLRALSAQDLQQRLVESFTRYMIPPTTAAGLFMLMGIHPAWGLRLVFETQRKTPMATPRPIYDDPSHYPQACLETLQNALFTTLGTVFELLMVADQDRRYRTMHLAKLLLEACTLGVRHVNQVHGHLHDLSPPLFIFQLQRGHHQSVQRALEFVQADLFGHYLVPAGVVRCFDDQTFAVNRDALESAYKMHAVGTIGQAHGLAKLLTQDCNQMVA